MHGALVIDACDGEQASACICVLQSEGQKKPALFNGHHRILCECVHGSICGLRACNAAAASIVRPGPKEWACHICARKHGVMSTTALAVGAKKPMNGNQGQMLKTDRCRCQTDSPRETQSAQCPMKTAAWGAEGLARAASGPGQPPQPQEEGTTPSCEDDGAEPTVSKYPTLPRLQLLH
jgi:hypothetical protein